MIPELERQNVPQWLAALNTLDHLPLKTVLTGSLYYPASGTEDGSPIKYLGGHIHSFVYADYGVTEEAFQQELLPPEGFAGYHTIMQRRVQRDELYPNGYEPLQLLAKDGNPLQHQNYIKPLFAIWTILERNHPLGDDHGPHRFSFLFICDEAVTVFHNLYCRNRYAPVCVAIIQSGEGFGYNWTDFRDPTKVFAREVCGNRAGIPQYLLYGGLLGGYDRSPWPSFDTIVAMWSNRENERYCDDCADGKYNFVLWNRAQGDM